MPFAHAIAPHLPFLRRYARALTGSQIGGDSYVRACLEAIIEDPGLVNHDLAPRVALYSIFHTIWVSGRISASSDNVELNAITAKLGDLAPLRRQALLLTAVEEFTDIEVGHILNTDEVSVRNLVREAIRDMTAHPPVSVLIIEDEPVIALDIRNIVEDLGHKVVDVAATRQAAVSAANQYKPALILADIQLADGSSGIEAVRDILIDGKPPVIFITAYPERLLTGERPEPTFLVTKPFMPNTVKAAISQALFLSYAEATV